MGIMSRPLACLELSQGISEIHNAQFRFSHSWADCGRLKKVAGQNPVGDVGSSGDLHPASLAIVKC